MMCAPIVGLEPDPQRMKPDLQRTPWVGLQADGFAGAGHPVGLKPDPQGLAT